jgi:hypothetical protein
LGRDTSILKEFRKYFSFITPVYTFTVISGYRFITQCSWNHLSQFP